MVNNMKERDKYILVIDSGNGGKFTLKQLRLVLPNEKFIYLEDDKNCPYGKKSKQKLNKISQNLVKNMLKAYPIKMIILACNTLSSCCYKNIKSKYNLPILAVTPFVKDFKKPTLILCTYSTKKYNKTLKSYAENNNVNILAFKDLAKKIDENIENLSVLQPYLDKNLKKYAKMHIRRVVLGCTHYNLIKNQIENALIENSLINNANKYRKLKTKAPIPIVLTNKSQKVIFYENSKIVAFKALKTLKALSILSKKSNSEVIYLKSSNLNLE